MAKTSVVLDLSQFGITGVENITIEDIVDIVAYTASLQPQLLMKKETLVGGKRTEGDTKTNERSSNSWVGTAPDRTSDRISLVGE